MRILFFLLATASIIIAQPKIPELKQWATDLTNTFSSSEIQQLNYRLKTYQDTTSNQLVFLMISSLDGYPLEDYSYETAEKNKIGTKEHSNGVLLLIVKNDKKIRIEVGYGLEGALPDAIASSIIRNEIIPYFRKNEFYKGVTEGINSIILAIGGEYKSSSNDNDGDSGISGFLIFIILIFILLFVIPKIKSINPGGFTYRSGGWGSGFGSRGGGFGGSGGFGGFSGGGGSFGGGGASGSW